MKNNEFSCLQWPTLVKNGTLEARKVLVFHSEFICFMDVSLHATLNQLELKFKQFLATLGSISCEFWPTRTQFAPPWSRLEPT